MADPEANLERVLARIVRLGKISPHPDPEVLRLNVAKVDDWDVVVLKTEMDPLFVEGCMGVFFEIDSVLPKDAAWVSQAGLESVKHVQTRKFKGVISQGIFLPLEVVHSHLPNNLEITDGLDVTELLGVTKWVEPESNSAQRSRKAQGPAGPAMPTYESAIGENGPPKTDEPNAQSCFRTMAAAMRGKPYEMAEKCDGMSMTAFVRPHHKAEPSKKAMVQALDIAFSFSFGLKMPEEPEPTGQYRNVPEPQWRLEMDLVLLSRNCDVTNDGGVLAHPAYQLAAVKYGLKEKLEAAPDWVFQMEVYGHGINGNHHGLTPAQTPRIAVFSVWDRVRKDYLDQDEMRAWCAAHELPCAPVIFQGDSFDFECANLLKMAEGSYSDAPKGGLKPYPREGLVVRPIKTQWTIFRGSRVRVSFKAKSREFLLINKQ